MLRYERTLSVTREEAMAALKHWSGFSMKNPESEV
jgi:hypothetical protein